MISSPCLYPSIAKYLFPSKTLAKAPARVQVYKLTSFSSSSVVAGTMATGGASTFTQVAVVASIPISGKVLFLSAVAGTIYYVGSKFIASKEDLLAQKFKDSYIEEIKKNYLNVKLKRTVGKQVIADITRTSVNDKVVIHGQTSKLVDFYNDSQTAVKSNLDCSLWEKNILSLLNWQHYKAYCPGAVCAFLGSNEIFPSIISELNYVYHIEANKVTIHGTYAAEHGEIKRSLNLIFELEFREDFLNQDLEEIYALKDDGLKSITLIDFNFKNLMSMPEGIEFHSKHHEEVRKKKEE